MKDDEEAEEEGGDEGEVPGVAGGGDGQDLAIGLPLLHLTRRS